MTPRLRTCVFVAVVAAHFLLLLVNAAVVFCLDLPSHVADEFMGWYCAVMLVQANLLAFWHCWGPRALVKRLLLATPLVPPISLGIFRTDAGHYLARSTILLVSCLYALQLVAAHAAFAGLKAYRGWRLADPLTNPDPTPPVFLQFGPRQFVLWTILLVALFFAGRWSVLATGGPAPYWSRLPGLPILLGGNAVMLALAVWAVFVRDSGLLWLAFASLLATVLTGIEVVFIHACRVQILVNEVFIWALNGTQFGLLLVSLLAIRGCGYRLRGGGREEVEEPKSARVEDSQDRNAEEQQG